MLCCFSEKWSQIWLKYSIKADRASCCSCGTYTQVGDAGGMEVDSSFIKSRFCKWKNSLCQDKGFIKNDLAYWKAMKRVDTGIILLFVSHLCSHVILLYFTMVCQIKEIDSHSAQNFTRAPSTQSILNQVFNPLP